MRTISSVLVIFIVCCMLESYGSADDHQESLDEQFKVFVMKYNKTYVNDAVEYAKRKDIFRQSLIRHIEINHKERELGGQARYGVNQFSDWTSQEFKEFLKRGSTSEIVNHRFFKSDGSCKIPKYQHLPSYWDWNKKGKVTSVKNQGKCGGCWAFAATELIETQSAIAGHKLQELSVQELISCSRKNGCSGGKTCEAMYWLISKNTTLVTAEEYPYEDESSSCKTSVLREQGVRTKNFCCFTGGLDEKTGMKPFLALHGPMAINVDATMWHDYIDGIIQHHCTDTDINHAVQITGYDETGEVPYWIVRNSWGSQFGKNGYLYIAIGKNLCGLAGSPSFVIV